MVQIEQTRGVEEHGGFTCVTCRIRMCNMTYSYESKKYPQKSTYMTWRMSYMWIIFLIRHIVFMGQQIWHEYV